MKDFERAIVNLVEQGDYRSDVGNMVANLADRLYKMNKALGEIDSELSDRFPGGFGTGTGKESEMAPQMRKLLWVRREINDIIKNTLT